MTWPVFLHTYTLGDSQGQGQGQGVDYYSASPVNPAHALGNLVPCEQNCVQQAPESSFGGVRIADRVRKTVPGGRTSNCKRQEAAVRV